MPLEGIFLVVDGDRGNLLVYHYIPSKTSAAKYLTAAADAKKESPYDFANIAVQDSRAPAGVAPTISMGGNAADAKHRVILGYLENDFVKLFVPHPQMRNKEFEMALDKHKFVGYPIGLPTSSAHETTFFHVVLVLPVDEPDLRVYKDIAMKFSKAVEHEQKREAYLSQNVQAMLKVKDGYDVLDRSHSSDLCLSLRARLSDFKL